ncbi:MAG: DUF2905 domain-containing protein [Acetobacteraceae bacterium]
MVARLLIIIGVALVLLGVIWPLFGHLPGDIQWQHGIVRVYIPIGSCILASVYLSAVLTGGLWFWRH